ncbi:MAG: hypothetical protein A3D44_01935 [Candidatus Staskawiczbacteria bacterium RIFCSPHIGHO2_02_FULL_42_22]|uniref:Single-stranded DNA-binding protein n=1 Tax=Candidatus Staskawiczbacteria bacterium RIFCSPHIGHO2_02_FULL_42_22 TaxID=1802207 RepID=A0A1G2I1R1_9BACT|nr:MAG: hypothetical protein A3D44_01935 [Candidatus Staskawiczbacteria bacterium RIFCSPHIGHO2_02_FULL_42_22]
MNFNKAFILGNVTRDPEVRALPSGTQVCSFGIATNRFYTDSTGQKKQEAEFHNIVCFGKIADIASKYVTKGSLIFIEGRIKTSSWQGTDGIKKFRTEIITETLQLGPRPQGTGMQGAPRPTYQAPTPSPVKTEDIPIIEENTPVNFASEDPKSFTPEEKSDEIDVKDIPF